MLFKTLHWYIFRELLRIFVLTASALTTLLAFGGTFKEVTKRGVDVGQLMAIMTNLMPAMLAYTIPIAALFAAVLVYWRLSTDNELTACRASGISFVAIVMPALFLGVAVASTDLVFVNYVVPVFLQRTERAIFSDLGSLMVSQIGRQEKFEFDKYVIYADSARQLDSNDPNTAIVELNGMTGTQLKDGKPTVIVVARQAILTITDSPNGESERQISGDFKDAAAFDPKTNQRISGSVNSALFGSGRRSIPSILKSKPKFANLRVLFEYKNDPTLFGPVKDVLEKIRTARYYQRIGERLYEQWVATKGEKPAVFSLNAYSPTGADELKVYAPGGVIDADMEMVYKGSAENPVRVEQLGKGKPLTTFYSNEAAVVLSAGDLPGTGLTASLELKGNVRQQSHLFRTPIAPVGEPHSLPGVVLPATVTASETPVVTVEDKQRLVSEAATSGSVSLHKLGNEAINRIEKLLHTIESELNSRASFAVACLTLVLLGAALGILMRGRNPLAVFVVGFVPAIVLVLLITAGRQVAEGGKVPTGIGLIWAGNVIILIMVSVAYSKLLRH